MTSQSQAYFETSQQHFNTMFSWDTESHLNSYMLFFDVTIAILIMQSKAFFTLASEKETSSPSHFHMEDIAGSSDYL